MGYDVVAKEAGRFKRFLGTFPTQTEADAYADKFSADEGIETVVQVTGKKAVPA